MEKRRKQTAGKRLRENVSGKYYVTDTCNGCGFCHSVAYQNFTHNADLSYYYVIRQPANEHEEHGILEAIELCQLDCIMDDGDRK